jgi:hypothetical protein
MTSSLRPVMRSLARPFVRPVVQVAGRIDALPPRDRLALAGGLLAAAIGIEMTLLMPLADKRQGIAASLTAQSASEVEALQAERVEREQRLSTAVARAEELQARLAVLGVQQAQRDALDGFVRRALQQRGTVLVGLRALPVEAIETQAPAAAAADANAAVADASAAAAAAPEGAASAPRLYRHRAEVTLEGAASQVAESVTSLEQGLKPLRVEQVLLRATGNAGVVRAELVFTTISPEATWLAL